MRLMAAEGFMQTACDLAVQAVLAFGGSWEVPDWPEPARSKLRHIAAPNQNILAGSGYGGLSCSPTRAQSLGPVPEEVLDALAGDHVLTMKT